MLSHFEVKKSLFSKSLQNVDQLYKDIGRALKAFRETAFLFPYAKDVIVLFSALGIILGPCLFLFDVCCTEGQFRTTLLQNKVDF